MTAKRRSRPSRPAGPWRALAGMLAVLVVGLGLAHVSPEAHAWVHGAETHGHESCAHSTATPLDAQHDEHVCAVVLFAQGAEAPVEAVFIAEPFVGLAATFLTPDALHLAKPRYLRHPERGPPRA